jgi:hypothetical protein
MPITFRSGAMLLVLLLCCAGAPLLAQRTAAPIALVQGSQVGKTTFDPGDTPRGGNGQPVDGIEGASREMLSVHIHAHLALFFHGEQIAIPCGIGIVKPFRIENGFVGVGRGFYWLHTHDATGIIHIESPDARAYTLGNFFDIWGEPLSAHGVAGLDGAVCAFVDGRVYSGDPRAIIFAAHTQITLEVGSPVVPPPVYLFPNGL